MEAAIGVFISHVEEDADLGIAIAEKLEEQGYSTWYYERDCVPGISYLVQTGTAIENCEVFLLLISKDSLSSHQIDVEIERSHEESKPIIPLRLDISHAEFQKRRPLWKQVIGTTASIEVDRGRLEFIVKRIVSALKLMNVATNKDAKTIIPNRPFDQGASTVTASAVQNPTQATINLKLSEAKPRNNTTLQRFCPFCGSPFDREDSKCRNCERPRVSVKDSRIVKEGAGPDRSPNGRSGPVAADNAIIGRGTEVDENGLANVHIGDRVESGAALNKGTINVHKVEKTACPYKEFYLIYIDKDNQEKHFAICGAGTVFRDEQTDDVVVESNHNKKQLNCQIMTVSREPVEFRLEDDRIIVRDKRSKNIETTFINGRSIRIKEDHEVFPGDVVTVGNAVVLRVEVDQNHLTVRKGVVPPISQQLADYLGSGNVIHDGNRYLLDPKGYADGKKTIVHLTNQDIIINPEMTEPPGQVGLGGIPED